LTLHLRWKSQGKSSNLHVWAWLSRRRRRQWPTWTNKKGDNFVSLHLLRHRVQYGLDGFGVKDRHLSLLLALFKLSVNAGASKCVSPCLSLLAQKNVLNEVVAESALNHRGHRALYRDEASSTVAPLHWNDSVSFEVSQLKCVDLRGVQRAKQTSMDERTELGPRRATQRSHDSTIRVGPCWSNGEVWLGRRLVAANAVVLFHAGSHGGRIP
jgi:hypothetical protein